MRGGTARWVRWAALPPTLFLAWFFVYPLVSILWVALTDGDRTVAESLAAASFGRVAWFTLWQAVASTLLTLVFAMPATYVFARFDFPFKKALRAAITIPFVLPTVVVGSAFLALLGPRGALGLDLSDTVWAILAAHVFFNVAVVVRTVGGFWASLDPRLEEAARVLGAGRWQAFREVTLPLLRPALAAASAIVFLFTFSSFGVVLILGGGLRFNTIEVAIWRRVFTALDLQGAALLSVIQLVGVAAVLVAYSRYQARTATRQRLSRAIDTTRRAGSGKERVGVFAVLAITLGLLAAPIVVLVERAFRTVDGYGWDHFLALGEKDAAFVVPPSTAIANSLRFAVIAALLAVLIGGLAAVVVSYGSGPGARWFDALLMLPLGTSAVTIGFGFLVALDWPIDLRTSVWLIPIAHALVAIPFVVRSTVPVMRSVQQQLRDAASTLGASPLRAFREVDLPIISRALMVGAGFAFAVSLGEFGATAFIARPNIPTLPIAIERFLSRAGTGSFGRAMAMSAVLMVVTAVSVSAIDRFRVGGGEF